MCIHFKDDTTVFIRINLTIRIKTYQMVCFPRGSHKNVYSLKLITFFRTNHTNRIL